MPAHATIGTCGAQFLAHARWCILDCEDGYISLGEQPSCEAGVLTQSLTCIGVATLLQYNTIRALTSLSVQIQHVVEWLLPSTGAGEHALATESYKLETPVA